MTDLTRKEFYKLAHECRDYAMRLATHDQDAVERGLCREFNQFRAHVASFDQLTGIAAQLEPARPITRWLVLTATAGVWLILVLVATQLGASMPAGLLLGLSTLLVFTAAMIPPRVYGTSVEAIEGRVLLVVEALQRMLLKQDLGFSEAAFYEVRDVLREANAELRQQVYLNRVDVRR